MNNPGRTFGIEMEFICGNGNYDANDEEDRKDLFTSFATHLKQSTRAEVASSLDNNNLGENLDIWRLTTDGSITTRSDCVGMELKTPILINDTVRNRQRNRHILQDILKSCKTGPFKCTTNNSCGLHVHVGISNEDVRQLKTSLFLAGQNWGKVFSSYVPAYRRNSSYARSRVGFNHYDAFSFSEHYPTIEIRLHEATLDASEILAWATFCLHFVDWLCEERNVDEIGPMLPNERFYYNFQRKVRDQMFWLSTSSLSFNRNKSWEVREDNSILPPIETDSLLEISNHFLGLNNANNWDVSKKEFLERIWGFPTRGTVMGELATKFGVGSMDRFRLEERYWKMLTTQGVSMEGWGN